MANTHALKTLITLETKECELAAQKLALAKQKLKESEVSLSMLREYRADYLAQFSENTKQGVNQQTYQNYQKFMKKLEQAIFGQEEVVKQNHHAVEQALAAWQAHERKKLSYGLLVRHDEEKQHQLSLKKEQKLMDESASRSIRLKLSKENYR